MSDFKTKGYPAKIIDRGEGKLLKVCIKTYPTKEAAGKELPSIIQKVKPDAYIIDLSK